MTTLQEYIKAVTDEIWKRFLITPDDCTDDEQIEQAWKDEEPVEEFVKGIGEKYDLTDLVQESYLL